MASIKRPMLQQKSFQMVPGQPQNCIWDEHRSCQGSFGILRRLLVYKPCHPEVRPKGIFISVRAVSWIEDSACVSAAQSLVYTFCLNAETCRHGQMAHLKDRSKVELHQQQHGVQAKQIPFFLNLDAIAGVQVWVYPPLITQDDGASKPAHSAPRHVRGHVWVHSRDQACRSHSLLAVRPLQWNTCHASFAHWTA